MKLTIAICCLAALVTVPVTAQTPTIAADGILNAASYTPSGFTNSGIAQGSIFVIFGSNLGGSLTSANFPLPNELAGTSVKVTAGGTTVDCPMVYASAGQVAAVLPSTTPVGAGTLTVSYQGRTSAATAVRVVASSFGTLALNQGGSGPAVITFADYTPSTIFKSAKPGDTMILWGTGLGPYSGDERNPATARDLNVDVRMLVGGQQATVTYKGRSNCCVGLDQINFVVPSGISGCYVPIVVSIGGIPSNFTSMSINQNGGTCVDPNGLPQSTLDRVAAGGTVKIGAVSLARVGLDFSVPGLGSATIKADTGTAAFYSLDANGLIRSGSDSNVGTPGTCNVFICRGDSCSTSAQYAPAPLNAGTPITITGPKGTKPIAKNAQGFYVGDFGIAISGLSIPVPIPGFSTDPYLEPGSYTASAPAGTDVGAFTARLTIPATLTWANKASITSVTRGTDLNVTWTGGGTASTDYVMIFGSSSTGTTPNVSGTFMCTEKASAGRFTVPAYITNALPKTGTQTSQGVTVPFGQLMLGTYSTQVNQFTASGLDYGVFTQNSFDGKNMEFK